VNEVRDVPGRHRYELTVDGAVVGHLLYEMRGGRLLLLHTEIDDAHEGRGLGTALIRGALDDIRTRGLKILPVCPFVERFIEKHPDYDDLVDHARFDPLNAE